MTDIAWQTEHSVETNASPEFAWKFMRDVANWDDPPAQFNLDGSFATGTHGSTQMPDQPEQRWQLRDVTPPERYTIEFPLDRAVILFEWSFTPLPESRTQLTQRVTLKGENAAAYLEVVQQAFAAGLVPGMSRIAGVMDRAYASH